jgi:recombination protein RecA
LGAEEARAKGDIRNMAAKSAALRAKLESALGDRIPAPFTFRERHAFETAPSGVPEIDALTSFMTSPGTTASEASARARASKVMASLAGVTMEDAKGGLPRGALTEIVGPSSSGRTTMMLALMAQMTVREEVCALVDASDAFDPQSAEAAGVDLKQLLWVRCSSPVSDSGRDERTPSKASRHRLEQALKATDLLLAGGGFGLVVIDLGDVPPQLARRVPLAHWFRFRRAVEDTLTVLVVLEQAPCAKTCASLVLSLETNHAYWSQTAEVRDAPKWGAQDLVRGTRKSTGPVPPSPVAVPEASVRRSQLTAPHSRLPRCVPHACLLRGARLDVEVVCSRLQHRPVRSMRTSVEVSAA